MARKVIVVGAGPTGACLAMLLAQRKLNVILIEATKTFGRQFRGEALMPSGLAALEQMELSTFLSTAVDNLNQQLEQQGLSKEIPEIPHNRLNAWEFWIEGQRLFRVNEPIESQGPPCTLISQPEFLQAVVQRCQEQPKFQFMPGTTVTTLQRQDRRITGVQLSNGQTLDADLVIAADGRNSNLREAARLNLAQQGKAIDVLWFELPGAAPINGENVFYAVVEHGNSFGLFRNAKGVLQLGWGVADAAMLDWKNMDWQAIIFQHSPPWLVSYLSEYLASHPEAFRNPRLFSVTVGLASRWSRPGLLMLGDAAHPMSPIRAQGINMALRDAIVAANHLVPILTEGGAESSIDLALQAIQAEREPEIREAQRLQAEELAQGEKLRRYPILRWGAKTFAPVVGLGVKQKWLQRQRKLRLGVMPVVLKV